MQEKSELYFAYKCGCPVIIRLVSRLPNQQFGRNVCRMRMSLGITQETLAEQAEISRRYLQQIEAGQMNPTINIAARLRVALKCTWDDLCVKV